MTGPTGPTGANPITNEVDAGNSSTAITIDFTAGANQKVTMTGNCTFTFTPPTNNRHVQVRMLEGAGGFTRTWPGTVKWANGTEPTWVTTAAAVNIANFFYDGTNYWGAGLVGFA
jgi:hypothetical protein